MTTPDFRAEAAALRDTLIARRRDFHQHPETAFEEVRTAGIVAKKLAELGLEVQTGVGRTGVVALLEGERPGPTVLLRADMDALPIQEENAVEYRSQTPGKMHACGHDGHTSILLAVADMLSRHRGEMAGRVKFVFQPAEEIGQGAAAMVADGVLDDPAPEVVLGLHLWNELPVGEVVLTPGAFMAGADRFRLQVEGRGTHGALPHLGHDPILAMAHIVTGLQSIASRNVPPLDTAVISAGRIAGGDAFNIVPQRVELLGTIRTFKREIRQQVVERLEALAAHTARALGCTAAVEVETVALSVLNDAGVVERLRRCFERVAPEIRRHEDYRTMVSEDVSMLMEGRAGAYFFVGSANAARGLNDTHHHPRFDIDEEALVIGAGLLASAAAEWVMREKN